MKLNLKHIVALTFILIATAYGDNPYWEDFEESYRQGHVKNLVEHIEKLTNPTLIKNKKDLDDRLNALSYFFSTGGKYGFRQEPATSSEEKVLKHALVFFGALLKKETCISLTTIGEDFIKKGEAPQSLLNGQRTYTDSVRNNEALKNHFLTCHRFISAASYVVHFPSFSGDMYQDVAALGFYRYVEEYLRLNNPWKLRSGSIEVRDVYYCNLHDVFNTLTEDLDQEALTIYNRFFVQKIQGTIRKRYQFDKMDEEIKSLFQKSPLYQTSKEFAVERKAKEDLARYWDNAPETAAIVYCRNGMIVRFKKGGGTVITGGSFVLSGCGFTIGRNKTLEENIKELERTVGVQSVQRF